MPNKVKSFIILLISFNLICSCSYRPILDENRAYLQAGADQAQMDVDHCTDKSGTYLKKYKARRAGKQAVRKGTLGAIFGGIFAFIFGGDSTALVKGLAIGAGVGAASGAVSVASEGKLTPDQMKRRYVSNCLARKGYSVLGWE